jgi:hypothetical protein
VSGTTTLVEETATQTALFTPPAKTRLQIAEEFVEHFQADVESAEKSVVNARIKLAAAIILRDDAEENLRKERITAGVATAAEVMLDMKRDAEAPDVDPITGEVKTAGYADVGRLAPDVPGFTPCVVVLWPGDDEPHVTEIGEHTTYLELIADYCSAVDGFAGGLDDFTVRGEDDGAERRSDAVIIPADYGHRFAVVAREEARA